MGTKKYGSEEVIIGTKFNELRVVLSLSYEEAAKQMLLEKEEIEKLSGQEDSEISVKVLYALYFFANAILENVYKDVHTHYRANELKKAFTDEFKRRIEA